MRYITQIRRLALASGLACSLLAMSSCDSDRNEPRVHNVQLAILQLKSFSITAEKDTQLSKVFFSIEHTGQTGKIANSKPLPYGKHLEKVKLAIVPANQAVKIYVAIGDGKFEEWKSSQEYNLPDNLHDIKIKVSLEVEKKPKLEYIYDVTLNRYKYNPETIIWQTASAQGERPRLSRGGYAYAMTRPNDVWLVESRDGQTRYYSHSGQAFEAEEYTGLPSGVGIKHIEAFQTMIYALGTDARLYRLSGRNWHPLTGVTSVEQLLGVLPPRLAAESPNLTLLVKDAQGKPRFAVYTAGRTKVSTLDVPEDFPRGWHRSFAQTQKYIGSSLTLVASVPQKAVGRTHRSTWYTTNGLDWSRLYSHSDAGTAESCSIFELKGMYYLFEVIEGSGLRLATSEDHGRSWHTNSAIALPTEAHSFTGRNILLWGTPDTRGIGLLVGANTEGSSDASLWLGQPKKDDY